MERIKTLPIFSYIKSVGNIEEAEMLSTFNCGVGMIAVVDKEYAKQAKDIIGKYYDCYEIGKIKSGNKQVELKNHIVW